MSGQRKSIIWHLLKVAGLWFVLAQAATIAANTYSVPAKPFTYVAVAVFFIHSLLVIFDATSNDGSSGRLYSGAATCLVVGVLIVMSLRVTQADDFDGVRKRVSFALKDLSDWIAGTDQSFRNMQAREHLAEGVRLIFKEGTRFALSQAQLHLRAIPPNSVEHASAQNLLMIVEARLAELGLVAKKSPLVITSREQTDGRFRITFRNDGPGRVKNVRYKVSYFRIPSGYHVEPDTEKTLDKTIRPGESRTLEFSDKILKTPVHASFTILEWETTGS